MTKIYCLDDDPSFNSFMELALKDLGAQAQCFTDPEQFLEALKSSPPDLVFLDLNIGHEDLGHVILKAIRNILGTAMPIVIVSSKRDSESISRGLKEGAQGFIVKPLSLKSLQRGLLPFLQPDKVQRGLTTSMTSPPRGRGDCEIHFDLEIIKIGQERLVIKAPALIKVGTTLLLKNKELAEIFGTTELRGSVQEIENCESSASFFHVLKIENTTDIIRPILRKFLLEQKWDEVKGDDESGNVL